MAELSDAILRAHVDAARAADAGWSPLSLRPHLIELRHQYRSGSPDFSHPDAREVYALAYHPYHALLMEEVLRQMADVLVFSGDTVRAVVLGAGPGAEVCGLTKVLADVWTSVTRLEVDLVDAEPGWDDTRHLTLSAAVPNWWGGELVIRHHTLDLTDPEGIRKAVALCRGVDLVCAQALLTELVMKARSTNLVAELAAHFSLNTVLLVTDFHMMPAYRGVRAALSEHIDAVVVRSTAVRLPLPPPPVAIAPLYDNSDGLRPRRSVMAEAQAFVRPGWQPRATSGQAPFTPSPDQNEAIEALTSFVTHRSAQAFVLSGPAGSGKTLVIGEVARRAVAAGRGVILCAPTGQAARRLGVRCEMPSHTLHSTLYGAPSSTDRGEERLPLTSFQVKYDGTANDVVIIDESSLISDERVTDTDDVDLLFGEGRLLSDVVQAVIGCGGQVVFVGDRHQLAPVGSEELPALDPEGLRRRGLTVGEAQLEAIHRQSEGSEILELAEECRRRVGTGEPLPPVMFSEAGAIQPLGGARSAPEWLLDAIWRNEAMVVASRHRDVETWITKVRERQGLSTGIPSPGDRLVLIRTDYSTGLLNGDEVTVIDYLGTETVRHVRKQEVVVTLHRLLLEATSVAGTMIRFEEFVVGELLTSAPEDRVRGVSEVLWVDFVVRMRSANVKRGTEDFLALQLADGRLGSLYCMYGYARTAHRAQGGEWDVVVCDLTKTNRRGVALARYAYTAVTRGRRTLWLSSWPKNRALDRSAARDVVMASIEEWFAARGVAVVQRRLPNNTGITIRLAADDSALVVNVYDTLTINIQKWPAALPSRAEFEEMVAAERGAALPARELDPNASEWLAPVVSDLETGGVDVEIEQRSDYQIRLQLSRGSLRAVADFSHTARGECRLQSTSGDVSLLARLDAGLTKRSGQL